MRGPSTRTVLLTAIISGCLWCWPLGGALQARTIVLTEADCEEMAVISADAPRMSWAAVANAQREFGINAIDLYPQTSFLIRYPLERIPPGQRITRAEWLVPYTSVSPAGGVRVQVRRLLVSWGAGVSHENRMIRPQRLAWSAPGARGVGLDRTPNASATAFIKGSGAQAFNVTQDVELWHSGAAKNYGWIVSLEEPNTYIRLSSPLWTAPKEWKLRITYEPE